MGIFLEYDITNKELKLEHQVRMLKRGINCLENAGAARISGIPSITPTPLYYADEPPPHLHTVHITASNHFQFSLLAFVSEVCG